MKKDNSVVSEAQEILKTDKAGWNEIYQKAKGDLFFLSDDPLAQWGAEDHAARVKSSRPALTIDMLSQFIHQTVNDIKMNTPSINVLPSGSDSSVETAEVYKGLIRNIEYSSAADDAYDNAATCSVKSSIGFIRVDHDYVDDEGFNQELQIKRVINPLNVFLDSNSVEPDGRDAMHCTIIENISVKQFKKDWPNKEVSSFEVDDHEEDTDYKDEDMITIVEQFIIIEEESNIAIDENGESVDYIEGGEYHRTRKITKKKVVRRKMSGVDVLEETSFAGKYIPLVPVYGEESWIKGKRNLYSLIRKSKGAQQMFNFWKSLETELIMKQPQAPIMAAGGSIEEYAEDWQNPEKAAVLRYDYLDSSGNPMPKPERLAPPTIPTGIVNASRETVDDIKATMGMYNASLGAKGNETSGVAINQRKMEGDVATYHFGDNLVKSITHVGRILVSAIPDIYDTERILRIIDEEEEAQEVGVNGAKVDDQEGEIDLTKGKYDVKVIAGASFTTRRQETAAAMTEMFRAQPDLMLMMGDLYFKNSDFTGAQAMAKRMEKAIDPKFLEEDEQEGQQLQQMQQQFEQVIQQMQGELLKAQEAMQDKKGELEIKAMGEQTKASSAQGNNEIKAAELRLKEQELELDKFKAAGEIEIKRRELDLREAEITGRLEQGQEQLEVDHEENLMDHHVDILRLEEEARKQSSKEFVELTDTLGNEPAFTEDGDY